MRYDIQGNDMPVVICHLDSNESMISEAGSMVWMSPNMEMRTTGGGLGKMFSRAFSGESLFQNAYTANGMGMIAFGSSFPGRILPLDIAPGREVILQKSSFLASEAGVERVVVMTYSTSGDRMLPGVRGPVATEVRPESDRGR